MPVRRWPLFRHLKYVSILLAVLIIGFVLLIPSGLVSIYAKQRLPANVHGSIPDAIGIAVEIVLIGLLISVFVAINRGKYSKILTEKISNMSDSFAANENLGIALHVLYYSLILGFGLILTTIIIDAFVRTISEQMSSDSSLSQAQIDATVSLLEVTGILLPAWIAFINIGIQSHSNPETTRISPRIFTSIAVAGYSGLLFIFISTSWALLPVFPKFVATSLVILNGLLIVIGVRLHNLDQIVLEQFSQFLTNDADILREYQ